MDFGPFSKKNIFGVKIGQKNGKSEKVVKSVRNEDKDNWFEKKSKCWILGVKIGKKSERSEEKTHPEVLEAEGRHVRPKAEQSRRK